MLALLPEQEPRNGEAESVRLSASPFLSGAGECSGNGGVMRPGFGVPPFRFRVKPPGFTVIRLCRLFSETKPVLCDFRGGRQTDFSLRFPGGSSLLSGSDFCNFSFYNAFRGAEPDFW